MSSAQGRWSKYRMLFLSVAAMGVLSVVAAHGLAAGERARTKTVPSFTLADFLVRAEIITESAAPPASVPGTGGRTVSSQSERLLPGSEGVLFHLELPAEPLLGSMHQETPDVCVFNADGEVVPFTLRSQGWRETIKTYRLDALHPLWGNAKSTESELAGGFRLDAQGRLVSRAPGGASGANAGDKTPRGKELKGYIIPLPESGLPIASMTFAWEKGAEATVQFSLQTSDDLKTWETLIDKAALVRFDGPDGPIESPRISLHGRRAGGYVRMLFDTGLAPAVVHSVLLEQWSPLRNIQKYGPILPRLIPEEGGTSKDKRIPFKAAALEYSLTSPNPAEMRVGKGVLPLEGLHIHNPKPGRYTAVKVFVRAGGRDAWEYLGDHTFFAVMHGGELLTSLPLPLGGRAVGQIRLESVVPGKPLPEQLSLSAQYRPVDLFFSAQGPDPYSLAWGSEKGVPSGDADIFSFVASGREVRKASLGTIAQPSVEDEEAKEFRWSEGTWLKYVLWVLLPVGIFLLIGMLAQLVYTIKHR